MSLYTTRSVKESGMKPKEHLVLEMCVKNGIDWGWNRAHKYFEHPPENILKEEIENAISHEIWEWFDMEVGDD